MRDPIGTMRKLYARFDESIHTADRSGNLAANPKGRFGKHEFKLEEFGLSADGVRKHFNEYCERFKIPSKG